MWQLYLAIFILIFFALSFFWVTFYRIQRAGVPRWLSTSVCVGVSFAIPLMALSLYALWGDSSGVLAWRSQQRAHVVAAQMLKEYKTPQGLVQRLQQVVHANPHNAKGWYLLGRLYGQLQRPEQALHAFSQAYKLSPHDARIQFNFAQASFVVQHLHLNHQAKQLLLQLQDNVKLRASALNLLALNAYQSGDYTAAIRDWRRLLTLVPASSANADAIRKAISRAQRKLDSVAA